jgi:hypothetical protein
MTVGTIVDRRLLEFSVDASPAAGERDGVADERLAGVAARRRCGASYAGATSDAHEHEFFSLRGLSQPGEDAAGTAAQMPAHRDRRSRPSALRTTTAWDPDPELVASPSPMKRWREQRHR